MPRPRKIEMSGTFDPHTIELLRLELRRLALRHGVEIKSMRAQKKGPTTKARRPGGVPAR